MSLHEADDIRPATERERSWAMPVDSVDDETRANAGGVTA